MQLCHRQLAPGEIDHELVWLSVSVSALGAAAAWLAFGLPWPRCVFHDLSGFPCVTCGATRAAIAFFHGNIATAWKWNPLVFAFLCGLSIFNVYALIVLVTRAPRLRITFRSEVEKKYARIFVIAALALNWIYLLSHYKAFA
jgi:hypothetical protein